MESRGSVRGASYEITYLVRSGLSCDSAPAPVLVCAAPATVRSGLRADLCSR